MKKQFMGKWFSFALVLAMLISLMGNSGAQAAKAPKISKKSVNVTAGKSATVTIKNKPSRAKITWKTKNAKIATVKNGKIKGVKAGKTTVTAKVVYKKGKKKITKNFRVKVTVKAAKKRCDTGTGDTGTGSICTCPGCTDCGTVRFHCTGCDSCSDKGTASVENTGSFLWCE